MSPQELARRIRRLSLRPPITSTFEVALSKSGKWDRDRVWYRSQKEHWLSWLSEYNGPRFYGPKDHGRSAEFAYNHVVCPPMTLYLGEAVRISSRKVVEAKNTALATGPSLASQSAAIRKIISWCEIESRLTGNAKRAKLIR